jgi:cell division protein FtsB
MTAGEIILVVIAVAVLLGFLFHAIYSGTDKANEKRRRQEELAAQHQLEMRSLRQEEERLEKQAMEERMTPSGRGKVFKAKKD